MLVGSEYTAPQAHKARSIAESLATKVAAKRREVCRGHGPWGIVADGATTRGGCLCPGPICV
eukprot:3585126-Alexandrium_andersonii.AAC.1